MATRFPEADIDQELNPGENENFKVDPVSSEIDSSNEMKATKFPEADVNKELSPGGNKNLELDSVSSKIASSNEIKEENESGEAKNKKSCAYGNNDWMQTFNKTILVSAIVVAVAGAAFAITKKLKEK